ncbi:MAG: molybdopterin-binding protein [Culicoidibacterales bacterium]
MEVEIICVGTELLLGEVLDTNSQYLAKILANYGFDHYYRSVVGDNEERLYQVIDTAFVRGAKLVILTGGLGPTQDDVTKEVAARYFKFPLFEDRAERAKIQMKYQSLGNEHMIESVYKQALFPNNCMILPNDNGTAPGCLMTRGNQHILVLPGPPHELVHMVEMYVCPLFEQWQETKIYSHVYHCFGLGESNMEAAVADIHLANTPVTIAPYANVGTSRIRMSVKAKTMQEAQHWIEFIGKQIYDRIGKYIFGENDETLIDKMMENHKGKRYGLIDCTNEAQLFWQLQSSVLAQVFCEQLAGSLVSLSDQLQERTLAGVVMKMSRHFDLDGVLVFETEKSEYQHHVYSCRFYDSLGNELWNQSFQSLTRYDQQCERTITMVSGLFWQAQ